MIDEIKKRLGAIKNPKTSITFEVEKRWEHIAL